LTSSANSASVSCGTTAIQFNKPELPPGHEQVDTKKIFTGPGAKKFRAAKGKDVECTSSTVARNVARRRGQGQRLKTSGDVIMLNIFIAKPLNDLLAFARFSKKKIVKRTVGTKEGA